MVLTRSIDLTSVMPGNQNTKIVIEYSVGILPKEFTEFWHPVHSSLTYIFSSAHLIRYLEEWF